MERVDYNENKRKLEYTPLITKKNKTTHTLEDVPIEVLSVVLSFLSTVQKISILRTSKSFYKCIFSLGSWVTFENNYRWMETTKNHILNTIKESKIVEKLTLKRDYVLNDFPSFDLKILNLKGISSIDLSKLNTKKLRSLTIEYTDFLHVNFNELKQLEELSIKSVKCFYFEDEKNVSKYMNLSKLLSINLVKLGLYDICIDDISNINKFNCLKELKLRIKNTVKDIEELHISNSIEIFELCYSSVGIRKINVNNNTNLRVLKIWISYEVIIHGLNNLFNLNVLQLCTGYTPYGVFVFDNEFNKNTLKNLQIFSIGGGPSNNFKKIDENGLKIDINLNELKESMLLNLKYFRFSNIEYFQLLNDKIEHIKCPYFNKNNAIKYINNLKNLKHLEIQSINVDEIYGFKNLETLNISYSCIDSLSKLECYNLKKLTACEMQSVFDLVSINKFKNLTFLDIYETQIKIDNLNLLELPETLDTFGFSCNKTSQFMCNLNKLKNLKKIIINKFDAEAYKFLKEISSLEEILINNPSFMGCEFYIDLINSLKDDFCIDLLLDFELKKNVKIKFQSDLILDDEDYSLVKSKKSKMIKYFKLKNNSKLNI